MSHHAQRTGCRFLVTSPSSRLTKLIQITGLADTFLAAS
jgi:anti-anti-sigma regulatory factor